MVLTGFLLTSLVVPSVSAGTVIESEKHSFRVETLTEGLKTPWGLVKLPDGSFLITERGGTLQHLKDGKLENISGVPEVVARGQGGLLDIELHPNYAENGWIYLAFSKPLPNGGHTAIVRARLKGTELVGMETVFDPPEEEATGGANHWGCRMEFDGKGYLFFTIGDRGDRPTPENNAQRLDNIAGKVHRIFDDGRVPDDNPFVRTEGARPTIWCYGNRNAQGLKFRPGTDQLWEVEHGPKGGDELNLIKPGLNYGWPIVTFGINYNGQVISEKTEAPGMEPPVIHWTPSIAVGAIDFYNHDLFPEWKGNLFVTALAHQKLVRVTMEGDKVVAQEELLKGTGRIRDVRCFNDGFIYLVYDQPGKVVRLMPTGS
jgi:glucose/arabinose dehydrogenase